MTGFHDLARDLVAQSTNGIASGVVFTIILTLVLGSARRLLNAPSRFGIWLVALVATVSLPLLARSGSGPAHHSAISLPPAWAEYLFIFWSLGVASGLLRIGWGLSRLRQLRRRAHPLELATLPCEIAECFQEHSAMRRVQLLLSEELSTPAVIGFIRPAILLPAGLAPQLSTAELRLVILHELAHIRRWDDWTNLTQKLLKCAFFFHPAVWWIENRMNLEREMACDDAVLRQVASPKEYASFLVGFHERLQHIRALALVQALVGRVGQLSQRVTEILDTHARPRRTCGKTVAIALAAIFALLVGLSPRMPEMVSFQSGLSAHVQNIAAATPAAPLVNAQFHPAPARPIMVPAVYHSTKAKPVHVTRRSPASPRLKVVSASLRSQMVEEEVPAPAPILIIYNRNVDGAPRWTICIFRFAQGNAAGSTFVLKI